MEKRMIRFTLMLHPGGATTKRFVMPLVERFKDRVIVEDPGSKFADSGHNIRIIEQANIGQPAAQRVTADVIHVGIDIWEGDDEREAVQRVTTHAAKVVLQLTEQINKMGAALLQANFEIGTK